MLRLSIIASQHNQTGASRVDVCFDSCNYHRHGDHFWPTMDGWWRPLLQPLIRLACHLTGEHRWAGLWCLHAGVSGICIQTVTNLEKSKSQTPIIAERSLDGLCVVHEFHYTEYYCSSQVDSFCLSFLLDYLTKGKHAFESAGLLVLMWFRLCSDIGRTMNLKNTGSLVVLKHFYDIQMCCAR